MTLKIPVNILVVVERPERFPAYEAMLAGLGDHLIRARSGEVALEVLLRSDVAVVVVEAGTADSGLLQLAASVRSQPRLDKTAVILISDLKAGDIERLKGYDSGKVDYLAAPAVAEVLRAKVATFSELYRKTEALEQLNHELEQRAEQLLRTEQARRESDEANQMKDEFLAILSHELRTPLNAITGWAHMLQAGGLDSVTQAKAVETINRNALLQARLISDLLDVSRIVSGKLHLELKPVDLPAVIRAAVDTIRPAAEAREIQIEIRTAERPGLVRGDAFRLQQVVWNLLSNAVKFTPRKGHVEISLVRKDSDLLLSVQDEGPGIRADVLPHIFEAFRQADATTTRPHQGLGLGLAIVRNLLQLQGGRVRAMNRQDASGAIFRVILPVDLNAPMSLGDAPRTSANRCEPADGVQLGTVLKGIRVLVVDDEADAREIICLILNRCGAQVVAAGSADEGFEILERELPDVLVADIEMPGEDGYSLVRRIRKLPADKGGRTVVIALTAHASANDIPKLVHAGFQRYVPKPLQPRDLISAILSLTRPTAGNVNKGPARIGRSGHEAYGPDGGEATGQPAKPAGDWRRQN